MGANMNNVAWYKISGPPLFLDDHLTGHRAIGIEAPSSFE
jgi:hypothetical protein